MNGVPFATLAQKIQANLNAVGFNIQLSGAPTSTWLTKYRDGKMAFGLSLWGPDYPDPADYLAFAPGQLVGVRAGWPQGSDAAIEKLAAKLLVTTSPAVRKSLYQEYQRELNQRGPYFPLSDPADTGLRVDERPEERRLQRGHNCRRDAGLAEVAHYTATRADG